MKNGLTRTFALVAVVLLLTYSFQNCTKKSEEKSIKDATTSGSGEIYSGKPTPNSGSLAASTIPPATTVSNAGAVPAAGTAAVKATSQGSPATAAQEDEFMELTFRDGSTAKFKRANIEAMVTNLKPEYERCITNAQDGGEIDGATPMRNGIPGVSKASKCFDSMIDACQSRWTTNAFTKTEKYDGQCKTVVLELERQMTPEDFCIDKNVEQVAQALQADYLRCLEVAGQTPTQRRRACYEATNQICHTRAPEILRLPISKAPVKNIKGSGRDVVAYDRHCEAVLTELECGSFPGVPCMKDRCSKPADKKSNANKK